jgi:IS30 family transposase
MKQRPRTYYTQKQKNLMWDRWQAGQSLHSIARLFGRHHPSIQGFLTRTGGIRPPKRRRSRLALTMGEREEIPHGMAAGRSNCLLAAKPASVPFARLYRKSSCGT